MARSRRRTPIFANAGRSSEKLDKRLANRALRCAVRSHGVGDERPDPGIRNVSDPWAWNKDGKHYWRDASERNMRK